MRLSGEMVKAAYQEVVEQLVNVFEDHLNGPRSRSLPCASAAWCWRGTSAIRTWPTISAALGTPRC